jgi:hypothetical protein
VKSFSGLRVHLPFAYVPPAHVVDAHVAAGCMGAVHALAEFSPDAGAPLLTNTRASSVVGEAALVLDRSVQTEPVDN